MTDRVAIVTGGNVGIGLETVRHLANLNCKVIIASRNESKALRAIEDVKSTHPNADLDYLNLDLTSFDNIKNFVKEYETKFQKLDILINNAGLIQFGYEVTENGFEKCFQINVLGPFLLTRLLLPLIEKSTDGRVVNVSSLAHFGGDCPVDNLNWQKNPGWYFGGKSYSDTKLMIVMVTKELAKRYGNTGVKFFSLHPGTVKSEFGFKPENNLPWYYPIFQVFFFLLHLFIAMNTVNGSKNSVFCAVDEDIKKHNGSYINNGKVASPWYKAKDTNLCRALYQRLCQYAEIDEE